LYHAKVKVRRDAPLVLSDLLGAALENANAIFQSDVFANPDLLAVRLEVSVAAMKEWLLKAAKFHTAYKEFVITKFCLMHTSLIESVKAHCPSWNLWASKSPLETKDMEGFKKSMKRDVLKGHVKALHAAVTLATEYAKRLKLAVNIVFTRETWFSRLTHPSPNSRIHLVHRPPIRHVLSKSLCDIVLSIRPPWCYPIDHIVALDATGSDVGVVFWSRPIRSQTSLIAGPGAVLCPGE